MSTELRADKVLDCKGLLCPIPVVKTARAIKEVEVGHLLLMEATDPGAPPDMEAWSRQTGHELVKQETADGVFRFWFRRTS